MSERCAVLFPGQGAYAPGILSSIAETEPLVEELLGDIDRSAARLGRSAVSRLLLDQEAPTLDDLVERSPEDLHLAIFALETVFFRLLTERFALRPDVLLGHSFGELVALTAAGVYDLDQGLALVAARDDAFAACPPPAGGMVAIGMSATRTARLLGALAEWEVAVAADNSPRQCVVSGPALPLLRVRKAAEAIGVSATELRVPYPFHSRGLAAVSVDFAERASALAVRPARRPVHSAILGRVLDSTDDVADLVAAHLVRPTRFADAVRALHADGVDVFVECGARGVLTDLVSATVPGVTAIAPLRRRAGADSIARALRGPRTDGPDAAVARPRPPVPAEAPVREAAAPRPGRSDNVRSDAPLAREGVIATLRQLYADALGYPADVLTADADLEADLGVDSIKQTELFARAVSHYGRRLPDEGSRLTRYTTLDALAELLSTLPLADSASSAGAVR
ncbi:acyltransferase domain-containing protein [Streptomyces sp. NPDC093109]|uniref:acyltransferase domain-containing protein n=1 Tax=Streptomyces sp. NPDC093109 TaxID=3154977 RepID=UPI00344F7C34